MQKSYLAMAVALVATVISQSASAMTISGVIRNAQGLEMSGAIISVSVGDQQKSVYSAKDGSYAISHSLGGSVKLRVRTPFYQDVMVDLVGAPEDVVRHDVTLTNLQSAEQASDSLASSAHAATLQFPSAELKASFISQCNYCHQIGNSLTRRPRSHDEWQATVERMGGYMALLNDEEKQAVTDTFSRSFTGKTVENIQTYEYSPQLANAKVEEWFFGDGLAFPHDAEIGSDGLFYAADEGHDVVWEINPETGAVKSYPLPDIDLPKGGKFSALQLPIGVYNGKHGPHSFAEDKHGKLWMTNALSGTLASFDIHTKAFELFTIPGDALYPHTIRIDQQGIIWFTEAISNAVVRFDPTTKQFTVIDLPANGFLRWMTEATLPYAMKLFAAWPGMNYPLAISPQRWAERGRDVVNLPYGIDVNPKDGSIWYAKLLANKIGRIDPQTLKLEEFDVPLSGPRRPRFDQNGILWIPVFDHGAIMKFDPASGVFTTYPMPTLAPGEWEAPYALNVHPVTGDVWITSNTSDRLFSFNPRTETFVAYPLPTKVTWMRDIVFTKDGKVCNSSSNLPSYAIEGGRPSIICLDPHGAEQDRQNAQ